MQSMRNESKRNAGTFGLVLLITGAAFTIVSAVLLATGNASWLNVATGVCVTIVGFSSYSSGRKERRQQELENDAREARERETGYGSGAPEL
ncbi:putative membrane protein YfcA [Pseudoclavibacter sp. JAI123]|uniref:hypothetical protein n=1 Tax=Pseudoclavibacter sp. JAI123 TaxID=2723065 RepID=UPI0015CD1397|nr:hypothetical protein [Pseudoclavibacter sp. JAI123]NYF12292.1 putative membrane protein YfcA [Pseudoclavibacter sp. JAI123]